MMYEIVVINAAINTNRGKRPRQRSRTEPKASASGTSVLARASASGTSVLARAAFRNVPGPKRLPHYVLSAQDRFPDVPQSEVSVPRVHHNLTLLLQTRS